MGIDSWIDVLILLSGFASGIGLLTKTDTQDHKLVYFMFAAGLITLGVAIGLSFLNLNTAINLRDYGELFAISLIISGLFGLIRNSKPVFARFPKQFIYLPFLILIFYPIISDTTVIKNLVSMIYQGGALLVAILLVLTSPILKPKQLLLLAGSAMVLLSYLAKWVIIADAQQSWIWGLLLIAGMLISSFGFYKLPYIKRN